MTTPKLTALFLAVFAITVHAQTVASLPYTCDFENATENANWTLENGTQTNKWFISTAAKNGGSYGLYISNNSSGNSNVFSSQESYVYAYRSINFAATGNHTVSFNWKSYGYSTKANLRAFLVPDNVATLTAGNANGNTSSTNEVPTGWIAVSDILYGQGNAWQSFSNKINVSSAGTYKLVFFWKNNGNTNGDPPAAVDNILVAREGISATALNSFGTLATPYSQPAVQTVTITNNSAAAVTLTQPTSTNFDIGTLSATSLAAGATATFTVQPKASLAVGTYNETIFISGSDGTGATAIANFNVAANTYYITGSSGSFSASKASAGGTAIDNGTGAIQTVIDAIRTDANGVPIIIQFGDGTNTLDIGSSYITFGNATPAWGFINLAGKITSSNSDYSYGPIYLTGNASITSTADIANTNTSQCRAVYNYGTGTVNISGGTVQVGCSFNFSYTVYNASTGKITVSGSANVTSANTSANAGTIHLYSSGSATAARLEIKGGTVENTATDGNAVYNASTGSILLSGDPIVTGTIMKAGTGVLSVDNNFNPANGRIYNLGFSNPDGVAVKDGKGKDLFFTLANSTIDGITISLTTKSDDLVLIVTNGYTVENSGGTYIITKGTGSYKSIQEAIDYIKTRANGAAVAIQFGDGTSVLDIGTVCITFGSGWGLITLTGKITSAYKQNNALYGIISLTDNASIASTADIANTDAAYSGAIYNRGSGTVTISGGVVQATGTSVMTVYNNGTGTINITGGLVFACGSAIPNAIYNTTISGNPAIITWNSTAGTTYTAFTSDNITKAPEATTAVWKNEEDSKGIYYANGDNTGFIPLDVTVNKINPTVSPPTGLTSIYGQTLANVTLPEAPNGTWAWQSEATTPVGNAGERTHQAKFTPTDVYNYNTLENIDVAITVSKATQSALTITSPATHTFGTAYTLAASGGTGEGTVTYAKTGGTGEGTISGSTLAITKAGTFAITATKSGGDNYNDITSAAFTLTVSKATQATLTITSPATHTYGTAYTLSTSGGSGTGAVTYAKTDVTGTGTISGSTLAVTKAGTFTITATKAADDNHNAATSAPFTLTVGKASGLAIQTEVSHQMISSGNSAANTFDLATITLNKNDHGTLSYTLGAFANTSSILASAPTLTGTTLTYTGTGKTSGTATQVINIASDNYNNATATITFEATPKQTVTISGITEQSSVVYDGSGQKGYTGTPAGTIAGGAAYTGSFVISYTGAGYGPTATPPTNAGEYTLDISVPSDNASYTGELRHEFTIEKATALTPAGLTATEGQTLASITLTGGWAWADATTVVVAGTQKYLANYTPADAVNYNALTNVEVSVAASATPRCRAPGQNGFLFIFFILFARPRIFIIKFVSGMSKAFGIGGFDCGLLHT
ncbi:hypothetical protein R83H12_01491 [Fibrobacteria bacterium R8-3-H12]